MATSAIDIEAPIIAQEIELAEQDNNTITTNTDSNSSSKCTELLSSIDFHRILRAGLIGMRKNLIPGLILQSFALILVLIYYSSSAAQYSFNQLSEWKSSIGLPIDGLISSLSGGLIPALFIAFIEYRDKQKQLAINPDYIVPVRVPTIFLDGLFLTVFWFIKGIEVSLFYQLQSIMFGSSNTPATIIPKVLVDQFVYNPFYGCFSVSIPYLWKNSNFNYTVFIGKLDKEFFLLTNPSVLMSTWMVWLPAVILIYSLPSPLQMWLFAIVLCFWSMLLALLTVKSTDTNTNTNNSNTNNINSNSIELSDLSTEIESNHNELLLQLNNKQLDSTSTNSSNYRPESA